MKGASGLPGRAWSRYEIGFWLLPVIAYFAFPKYLTLGSQVLIAGLFALSLDLILGYARIISLGHAAYFASARTRLAPGQIRLGRAAERTARGGDHRVGGGPLHELSRGARSAI